MARNLFWGIWSFVKLELKIETDADFDIVLCHVDEIQDELAKFISEEAREFIRVHEDCLYELKVNSSKFLWFVRAKFLDFEDGEFKANVYFPGITVDVLSKLEKSCGDLKNATFEIDEMEFEIVDAGKDGRFLWKMRDCQLAAFQIAKKS